MNNKTIAIVQARMGSSRFPGKPLEKIGKWSITEWVLKRVTRASMVDQVVLATSINPKDDVLANHVEQLGYQVFRGSESDVLSRFYNAAKQFEPSNIVRITGDCPLISPNLIDHAINKFLEKRVDYLSLSIGRDKKCAYPRGFDVEIAKFQALEKAAENATKDYEREHVMPYLYSQQNDFSLEYLEPLPVWSRPEYRLCVDTKLDLSLILQIYDFFNSELINIEYKEIIRFLDNNPEIVKINQSVGQKHYTMSEKGAGQ